METQITGKLAVIGDVHGRSRRLAKLLRKLNGLPDAAERWIVFVGDFLDRGPDPKGVLD